MDAHTDPWISTNPICSARFQSMGHKNLVSSNATNILFLCFSIAIILMGKRELVALLSLSSLCLVMVEWLFLSVPGGCLQFVIVVFPNHTHLLFCFVYTYWLGHIKNICRLSNFICTSAVDSFTDSPRFWRIAQ